MLCYEVLRQENFKRLKMKTEDILPSDAPKAHKKLLRKWLRLSQIQPPARADFDFDNCAVTEHEPYEIVALPTDMGHVMYSFGRVSAKAETRIGQLLAGNDVKEALDPKLYPSVAKQYQRSIATGEPHYWERYSSFYGRDAQHYKRLLLPLVNEHGQPGWLLSSMVWPFHEDF